MKFLLLLYHAQFYIINNMDCAWIEHFLAILEKISPENFYLIFILDLESTLAVSVFPGSLKYAWRQWHIALNKYLFGKWPKKCLFSDIKMHFTITKCNLVWLKVNLSQLNVIIAKLIFLNSLPGEFMMLFKSHKKTY